MDQNRTDPLFPEEDKVYQAEYDIARQGRILILSIFGVAVIFTALNIFANIQ